MKKLSNTEAELKKALLIKRACISILSRKSNFVVSILSKSTTFWPRVQYGQYSTLLDNWDKVFKNGRSKICGRQPLKNFTWSILLYFVPNQIADILYFSHKPIYVSADELKIDLLWDSILSIQDKFFFICLFLLLLLLMLLLQYFRYKRTQSKV